MSSRMPNYIYIVGKKHVQMKLVALNKKNNSVAIIWYKFIWSSAPESLSRVWTLVHKNN